MELCATVTLCRGEYITRQALRVYAHKRRDLTAQLAFEENHKLLFANERTVTGDLELTPFGG